MNIISFFPITPVASEHLPLTIMTLNDWVLVNVFGQDSEKYLQSQVTADVTKLTYNQHLLVAHCNSQGKVWSNLHLFRRGKGFSFIERRSVLDLQLKELKKYSIFSKVTFIPDDTSILLGIAGFQVRNVLENLFDKLPNVKKSLINDQVGQILWFEHPIERFLLITDKTNAEYLINKLHKKALLNNSQQWLSLNIEAGIPIIDFPNSGLFIPQAINLQIFGGLSFTKGCYLGQEAILRTKSRGANKRALWYLSGTVNRIPEIGEKLELKIDSNWKYIGTVLAAVQVNDGRLLLQAVISKNISPDSILRVYGDMHTLSIQPLPYLLKE